MNNANHNAKSQRSQRRTRGATWLMALGAGGLLGGGANAATFTVTNTADAGAGSLRAAITSANSAGGADEIVFSAGLTGTITPASALPDITDTLRITGPGARNLSIGGGNARRIFNITAPATISGLRLANAFADFGGGIRFTNAGTLTLLDCHFDQNTVTSDGGAVQMQQGSLDVQRCTFTTDQAAGNGGVISYGQGGGTPTVSIVNCTFVNNFASNQGGAIRQGSTTAYTATVTNCTFVVNNAGTGGGAIHVGGGTMTLLNNIFTANNAGGNPGGHLLRTGGTLTSLGHNLFGNLNGANFTPDATDRFGVVGAELNTGVLIAFPFNNGGPTDTVPLNAGSIAIDGGGIAGAPLGDQRGLPRIGCGPDVGAFEVQTLTDSDADGIINCLDQCPNTPACALVDEHGCPTDSDADGVVDGCDQCPNTLAGDPVDAAGCSTADEDGDGVLNDVDQCRGTPPCARSHVNPAGCPIDSDGDGIFDGCDNCPAANDLTDTDRDGIPDCLDDCPNVGDTDLDGVQDCHDGCPNDPLKTGPGACGCGKPDTDSDNDGVPDCFDGCPNDRQKSSPGACGCGKPDTDTDKDGVADCLDGCPNDPLKSSPGTCGCGKPDTDTDNDGVPDCFDGCPNDPKKSSPGTCGCGNADTDANGDGIPDCLTLPQPAVTAPPATTDTDNQATTPKCGAGMSMPLMALLTALLVRRGISRRKF